MSKEEKKFYFYVKVRPTKTKKISVPESKLTNSQKEQIYDTFLTYFAELPGDCQDRFMKTLITNLNKQVEHLEKQNTNEV